MMSPMSTAAMNAVDRTKAGVASGTLTHDPDGRRHVRRRRARRAGGRVGRHDLAQSLPRVPARRASGWSTRSAPARRRAARRTVRAASEQAFVDALGTGLTIAASRRAGRGRPWFLIAPGRPQPDGARRAEPEAAMV